MPYIVAVIALVVASIGFTLFQSSNQPTASAFSEPVAMEQTSGSASTPITIPTIPDTSVDTTGTTPTETASTSVPNTPSKPNPIPTSTPAPIATPVPVPTPVSNFSYKNGTYKAQSSYRTPGGTYQMQVTLSVANDNITAANVAFDGRAATDGYSRSFSDSYQSKVVGQSLSSVHPSRVGGASLTTNAFNNALNTIRTQATS